MEINLIALAIPVFFLLIFVEAAVVRIQGKKDIYRFHDAITDLGCGVSSQVIGVFSKGSLLLLYTAVWSQAALLQPQEWVQWILAFIGVDFCYYWWHRASHRLNFLWAGHIVHHQSQDYNLAVALRQAWFTRFSNLPFMLPLALLGVHPLIFAASDAINTLYQFWIHTQTIGKLGPLEWILNTPSHHRIHHAINPRYIDKNYAGIFIIWDRMFGTFIKEEEEAVYGTVAVFESWDPVWANFHYWMHMCREAQRFKSLKHRLWIWFAPPEWQPSGPKSIPEVHPETFTKWTTSVSPLTKIYVGVSFFPTVCALVWMLWFEKTENIWTLGGIGVAIVVATFSFGALLEGRKGAATLEAVRLIATAVLLVVILTT